MALFKKEGPTNQRRRDVESAAQGIATSTYRYLSGDWADIAEALGWPRFASNGGALGPSQLAHSADNWEILRRNFGSGQIDENMYDIAVTVRRRKFDGTRTLRLGVCVAIEWREPSGAPREIVVVDKEFGDVMIDTSLDALHEQVRDLLVADDTKYRTVQALRKAADQSSIS